MGIIMDFNNIEVSNKKIIAQKLIEEGEVKEIEEFQNKYTLNRCYHILVEMSECDFYNRLQSIKIKEKEKINNKEKEKINNNFQDGDSDLAEILEI